MVQKRILNRKDAASYLGISPSMLDKLVARGDLPRVKLGKRVIFKIEDLEGLLERYRERRSNTKSWD
ncbi:MAG: helix-turn-helix domain-containing protein [Deltaproteobacteria bacterium]|nr:helix-turn-helix domain-containing protein [Deltaproteobacteria bacterium]